MTGAGVLTTPGYMAMDALFKPASAARTSARNPRAAGSVSVRSCQHREISTTWAGAAAVTALRFGCAVSSDAGIVATRSVAATTAAAAVNDGTVNTTARSTPARAYAAAT